MAARTRGSLTVEYRGELTRLHVDGKPVSDSDMRLLEEVWAQLPELLEDRPSPALLDDIDHGVSDLESGIDNIVNALRDLRQVGAGG